MVNPPVSIDPMNGQREGVRIFPNPTSGLINVSLDAFSGKTVIVEISDLMGEVLLKNTFINSTTMNLADKPKGLYILTLQIDNEIIIRKICIK